MNKKLLSITLILLSIMIMPLVSSFEFDNVKTYDPINEQITFKNSIIGIPTSEIATAKLLTPRENYVMPGKNRIVAEIEVDLKDNSYNDFIKNMQLFDMNKDYQVIDGRPIIYKYKIVTNSSYPTYKNVCKNITLPANETSAAMPGFDCHYEYTGDAIQEIATWEDLTPANIQKGKTIIGISSDVYPDDNVEWVPTLFGLEVNEWAVWTSSINKNIIAYWDMSNESRNIPDIATGRFNFTMQGNCTNVGFIGNGFTQKFGGNGIGGAGCFANISNSLGQMIQFGNNSNTLSFWYKRAGYSDGGSIFELMNWGDDTSSGAGNKGNVITAKEYNNTASLIQGWANFYDVGNTQLTEENIPNNGDWHLYVQTRNTTGGVTLYKDGVKQTMNLVYQYNMTPQSGQVVEWLKRGSTQYLNASLDEVGIWNRTLSDSEILDLYNNGTGLIYVSTAIPVITSPYPLNNTKYSSAPTNTLFNCSATALTSVVNVSLYINNVINTTITGASTPLELITSLNFSDGSYTWYCEAYNVGSFNATTERRLLGVDTLDPTLSIVYPTASNYTSMNQLNYTAIDSNRDGCGYSLNGAANVTIPCGTNVTGFNSTQGYNTITMFANDTFNHTTLTSVTFFLDSITPLVSITYPQNTTYTTNVTELNYTAIDTNLQSCWYTTDNGQTNTTIACGTNITGLTSIEGSNTWKVYANDSIGHTNSSSITFGKDTIGPVINIISPKDYIGFKTIPYNISLLININDTSLNACWYTFDNGATNTTLLGAANCANINSTILISNNNLNNQVQVYANDSINNIGYNNSYYNISIINSLTYSPYTTELALENFKINITYDSLISSIVLGNLNYNGTDYSATSSGSGNNLVYSRDIIIPIVAIDNTTINFYWDFYINTYGIINQYNLSSFKQNISKISIDNCSVNTLKILNYSLWDEDNQTMIDPSLDNTIIETDLRVSNPTNPSLYISFNKTATNVNPLLICFPSSNTLNTSSYRIDAITRYQTNNRVSEYNYIQNFTVNNNTIPNTIRLYDLLSSRSQEFLITYKDSNFLPVQGAVIDLERYYIGEGVFKSVENGLTDTSGQTLLHLVLSEPIYNFVVKKDGHLLARFDNLQAICQASPCQVNLNQIDTNTPNAQFNTTGNLISSLTFNQTTRTFTLVFSTTDGSSTQVNLTVDRWSGYNNDTVCDTSLTTSSGILTCVVPTSYGNTTFIADIFQDNRFVKQSISSVKPRAIETFGYTGIVLGAFAYLMLAMMAFSSGVGIIIFGAVGLLLIGLLNVVSMNNFVGAGATFIWAIIGSGVIIWKIAQRRGS